MIKTILVPTDGSTHANNAVGLAAEIAGKCEARMILLHVLSSEPLSDELRHMAEAEHLTAGSAGGSPSSVPEGRFPASMTPGSKDDSFRVRRVIAENLLTRAEHQAKATGAHEVRQVIEDGDPVKQILQHAESDAADLIVMGSRGLGDLKGLLVGSVSHKVSQMSPCACTIVK